MSGTTLTEPAVVNEEAANTGYFDRVNTLLEGQESGSARAIQNFIKTDGTKTDIASLFKTLTTEQGTYDFSKAHLAYALDIAGATEEQILNAIAFLDKAKRRILSQRASFRSEETAEKFFEGIMKPQTKSPEWETRKKNYSNSIDTALRNYRSQQIEPIAPQKDIA